MSKEENLKKNSYKCSICRDTGWIIEHKDNMQPLCTPCECIKIEKAKAEWKASGINPEAASQTFSNFEIWNEESKKMKDAALNYYYDFESIRKTRKNSIILCGQVGSGKSHLTIALGINLLHDNVKVVYMPYRDVITRIKQNILDEEYYRKLLSKYQTCDVLLIDDLYKGKITESDINIVFEIINYRYLNYLPIIVSSEYPIEKLLYFDEAIGSRIYEMGKDYVVEINNDLESNYRLK